VSAAGVALTLPLGGGGFPRVRGAARVALDF
jgi:hypothetical protein